MNKKLAIALASLLAAGPWGSLWAQAPANAPTPPIPPPPSVAPAPAATGGKQSASPIGGLNSNQPVSVGADNASLSENDRMVVLTGNVVVTQGDMKLTADKVTAYYINSGNQPKPDNSISGNIDRMMAEGNVVVTRPGQVVKSASANYETAKHQIVMLGHVVATRGPNIVRGERVVVDLNSQNIKMDMGAPGTRVQGLFVPQKSGQPADTSTSKKP